LQLIPSKQQAPDKKFSFLGKSQDLTYQFFGEKNLSFTDNIEELLDGNHSKKEKKSIYEPDETHTKIVLSV
jgi:hypothetical protein